MKALRIIVVAVVLVGLGGLGVALARAIRGQDAMMQDHPGMPRHLEVLAGRGSEIGVSIRDVEPSDVSREKLPGQAGAVVDDVRSNSPAAKAGLKSGDVFVEFDGERVRSARQLSRLVQETPPGRTVKATVMRGGSRLSIELTPDTESGFAMGEPAEGWRRFGREFHFSVPEIEIPEFDFEMRMRTGHLGVTVQELTPQLASYFGAKDGVLVTGVGDGTVGANAGLKAGDVITTANGAAIGSASDLRRELSRVDDGQEVTLGILRDKKEMTLKATLEGRDRVPRRLLRRSA